MTDTHTISGTWKSMLFDSQQSVQVCSPEAVRNLFRTPRASLGR